MTNQQINYTNTLEGLCLWLKTDTREAVDFMKRCIIEDERMDTFDDAKYIWQQFDMEMEQEYVRLYCGGDGLQGVQGEMKDNKAGWTEVIMLKHWIGSIAAFELNYPITAQIQIQLMLKTVKD